MKTVKLVRRHERSDKVFYDGKGNTYFTHKSISDVRLPFFVEVNNNPMPNGHYYFEPRGYKVTSNNRHFHFDKSELPYYNVQQITGINIDDLVAF